MLTIVLRAFVSMTLYLYMVYQDNYLLKSILGLKRKKKKKNPLTEEQKQKRMKKKEKKRNERRYKKERKKAHIENHYVTTSPQMRNKLRID